MRRLFSVLLATLLATVPACRGVNESSDQAQRSAPEKPVEPIGGAEQEIGGFSASMFQFSTQVEDGGHDQGGGYQTAGAKLRFVDPRQTPTAMWACSVTLGMPLRTKKFGKISPARAAQISADVATSASHTVMHSRGAWLRITFCLAFQDEMNRLFGQDYEGLGARAYAR
jgi:hypothetical protein